MKTIYFVYTFCIAVATFVTAADKDFKLLFVQILFRHGDRAPIQLYPTDPNNESFWPEGLGKLTKLGRQQHYGLGKFLRSYYKDFVTSSPLEINVISSETDRCLKSAETNIAAFYAPNEKWKFDENVDWQPISIHYIPGDEDKYLETDSYCPRADAEQEKVVQSPEGQAYIAKHQAMFDNLTYYSGEAITNWTSANYLHDVLWIEKRYNLTVPKWVEYYWDELEEVSAGSFFWSFNSPLLHRLRAGPLLQRIIQKMNEKIKSVTPDLKFQVYSAHDSNVAIILDSLNLFNMKQPPYCASLLFELYIGLNDMKFIRLLYLNSTEPQKGSQVPHVLILKGCTEFCPLEYFVNITQDLMPGDWEKECQLSKSLIEIVKSKETKVALFLLTVGLIIAIMSALILFKWHKQRRDKYAYHLMTMN